MKSGKMNIYIMTHREFVPPQVAGYTPLQVGASLHEDLGYQRDDEGDNISAKNGNYSELTGLYWMWKHAPKAEITGLVHYRRYFVDAKGDPLDEAGIREIMDGHQAIMTPELILDTSVREQYEMHHVAKDLDLVEDAIRRISPEYLDTYHAFLSGNRMHFANMIITSSEIINRYAEWLFSILFDVEAHMDMTGYDDYNRRVYGFLSERLITVWLLYNKIDFVEHMVALVGTKADIKAADETFREYLNRGDMDGAAKYYADLQEKHPDYFHMGSGADEDFIHHCIIVEIYQLEVAHRVMQRIDEGRDADAMVRVLREVSMRLGECMQNFKDQDAREALVSYIEDERISPIAMAMMVNHCTEDKTQRLLVYSNIAESYLVKGDHEKTTIYAQLAMQQQ
jgi:hypothetical protein